MGIMGHEFAPCMSRNFLSDRLDVLISDFFFFLKETDILSENYY